MCDVSACMCVCVCDCDFIFWYVAHCFCLCIFDFAQSDFPDRFHSFHFVFVFGVCLVDVLSSDKCYPAVFFEFY